MTKPSKNATHTKIREKGRKKKHKQTLLFVEDWSKAFIICVVEKNKENDTAMALVLTNTNRKRTNAECACS